MSFWHPPVSKTYNTVHFLSYILYELVLYWRLQYFVPNISAVPVLKQQKFRTYLNGMKICSELCFFSFLVLFKCWVQLKVMKVGYLLVNIHRKVNRKKINYTQKFIDRYLCSRRICIQITNIVTFIFGFLLSLIWTYS